MCQMSPGEAWFDYIENLQCFCCSLLFCIFFDSISCKAALKQWTTVKIWLEFLRWAGWCLCLMRAGAKQDRTHTLPPSINSPYIKQTVKWILIKQSIDDQAQIVYLSAQLQRKMMHHGNKMVIAVMITPKFSTWHYLYQQKRLGQILQLLVPG